MKILDWYILKKFLSTFVFAVLILVSIILVIDFTEKNDDFIQENVPIAEIIFDYYINLIPFYANMLSPITVFIATVFVTAKLASHTEIVAMLSSGISFKRLLLPYIVGATFIGALIFGLIGWVIPNANKKSVAFQVKYVKSPYTYDSRNIHIKIAPDAYVFMESYNNNAHIGYNFSLEQIEGTTLKSKITSNSITWDEEAGKWHMDFYTLRTFNGEKETIFKGQDLDTTLNMQPKDFESTYKLEQTLTLPELNNLIAEKKMRGADDIEIYLVEKYERFSYPFAIIILTVIGVIVSARKARGGVGVQIALGFFLAFVFIVFVITSRSLAQVGDIPPQIAAWIPTIVFTGIGFFTLPLHTALMPRLKDFIELHFVIFLWGFTAILGKLITIPAVELVAIRTLITAIALALIMYKTTTPFWLGRVTGLKMLGVGFLIAGHWILFFAAARVSSVSICLIGMATASLWTAFLEPMFTSKKIKPYEVLLALLIILGLYIIFRKETDFKSILGISMAIGSALLASIFTIINADLVKKIPSTTITCYEMGGAFLGTILFFPVYTSYFAEGNQLNFNLIPMDWVYLAILILACTVYAYTAGVRLMQRISAFTMNLTVNLEPVYGIILAIFIFNESSQLSQEFYIGAGVVLLSVFIYPVINTIAERRKKLQKAFPDEVVLRED